MKTIRIDLEVRLNDPRWHGWMADLHWETLRPGGSIGTWAVDGRVTCVGITLTSVPLVEGTERPVDGLELTTRLVRGVPWSTLIATERTALLREEDSLWADPIEGELLRKLGLQQETPRWREWRERHRAVLAAQHEPPLAQRAAPRRSGRPPKYPDQMYAEVAAVYAQALQVNANPTQAVAEAFDCTRTTAAKWVTKARSMFPEFPPPPIGRAGAPSKRRESSR